MKGKMPRSIVFYGNFYFKFYDGLRPKVRKKINWTLQLIATTERVPEKFFKHITGSSGLYEIRVEVGSDIFRIFSFFDKGNLVVVINGFSKKSQKTPPKEIERAERIKKQYFDEKEET